MDLEIILKCANEFLLRNEYKKVIETLMPVKEKRDYIDNDNGYLVDYILARAKFKKFLAKKPRDAEDINEIIVHLNESMRLNPRFSDSYLLIGYAYMHKEALVGNPKYGEKSIAAFEQTAKARPDMADICHENIETIKNTHRIHLLLKKGLLKIIRTKKND